MGFLRKLGKALTKPLKFDVKVLKKVGKVAMKTAPIWTNFVPGGSAINTAIQTYQQKRAQDKAAREMTDAGEEILTTAGVAPAPAINPASDLTLQLLAATRAAKQYPQPNALTGARSVKSSKAMGIRGMVRKAFKLKPRGNPLGLKLRAANAATRARQENSRARIADRFDHNRTARYDVVGKLAPNMRWKAVRARRERANTHAARQTRHVDLRARILSGVRGAA